MTRKSPPAARQAPSDTASQILDVAERLAQTRGFNGFSYADIAEELGITKASLHYHYATKGDLGRALIDRYSASFGAALDAIDQSSISAAGKLQRYVKIYADVLHAGRICLCGMLAAEYTTLPSGMQDAIRGFFDANERGLARMLDSGRQDGSLAFEGTAEEAAHAITSALEGALLLARPYGSPDRFLKAAQRVVAEFAPAKRLRAHGAAKLPPKKKKR